MKRLRLMLDSAWPTLMFLLFFAVLLIVADSPTPDNWHVDTPTPTPAEVQEARDGSLTKQTGWEDVLIFTLAFTFLSVKSTIMLKRMGRPVDWLTITLVAANGGFMSLYLLVTAQVFQPEWFLTHPAWTDAILRILRWGLIISLAWGTIVLVSVPPGTGYYVVRRKGESWTGESSETQHMRRSQRQFRRAHKSRSATKHAPSTTPHDRTPV